jgi:hypothetical protein
MQLASGPPLKLLLFCMWPIQSSSADIHATLHPAPGGSIYHFIMVFPMGILFP